MNNCRPPTNVVIVFVAAAALLFFSSLSAAMAEESTVQIVYVEKPEAEESEAFHIRTLAAVLGSEEAARDAVLYHYTHATSGFSAKLTPKQIEDLSKDEHLLDADGFEPDESVFDHGTFIIGNSTYSKGTKDNRTRTKVPEDNQEPYNRKLIRYEQHLWPFLGDWSKLDNKAVGEEDRLERDTGELLRVLRGGASKLTSLLHQCHRLRRWRIQRWEGENEGSGALRRERLLQHL